MGQRSQIYVRIQEGDKYHLIARYYGWVFAERMISRCRYTLEWIRDYQKIKNKMFHPDNMEKLKRILDTNFDMHDVILGLDIIKEYYSLFREDSDIKEYVFYEQHNDDGKLFIDVPETEPLKYAFLDTECHEDIIMDAERYMHWNHKDWKDSEYIEDEQKERCKSNMKKNRKFSTVNDNRRNIFIYFL